MDKKFSHSSIPRLLEYSGGIPVGSYATRCASNNFLNCGGPAPSLHPSHITPHKKGRKQLKLDAQVVKCNPFATNGNDGGNGMMNSFPSKPRDIRFPLAENWKEQSIEGNEKMLSEDCNANGMARHDTCSESALSHCTSILSELSIPCHRIRSLHVGEQHRGDDLRRVDNSLSSGSTPPSSTSPFVHPVCLFNDEESILFHFGMGGRVSPSRIPGFTGFFRQHWKDFHVTEMFYRTNIKDGMVESTKNEEAICVPRQYDFSIPSPLFTSSSSSCVTATGRCEAEKEKQEVGGNVEKSAAPSSQSHPEDTNSHSSVGVNATEDLMSDFFSINVERHLKKICLSGTTEMEQGQDNLSLSGGQECTSSILPSTKILQCVLHKRHIAHSTALSLLAQTLRIHPRAISVAGMKDYIGDTAQRIRFENVSPSALLKANELFKQAGVRMTLSHFSYEENILLPGDLYGNHFKIVLRGVHAPKSVVQDAIQGLEEFGFPNYYGCQRFSWFGGGDDAAFALLLHNPLVFAFRFLNYTRRSRTLRELLQRPRKYPHPVQDQYRRNVVRRLRRLSIDPQDLDEQPFLTCPSLADMYEGSTSPYSIRQNLIIAELWHSFLDLDIQSRRPTAQSLSSYLWNQALTLRLHHFGGQKILDRDFCIQKNIRQGAKNAPDRAAINNEHMVIATPERMPYLSIEDVVHPGFSFQGIALPQNPVGDIYLDICDKYHLSWHARHAKGGLRDFLEPPRPIVRRPLNLTYDYQQDEEKLTISFALERGCYANVAISELMKLDRCAGSEEIRTVPLPDTCWEEIGQDDPGYVTSQQDIYVGYEDGLGFTGDKEEVELNEDTAEKIWDVPEPLFLPPEKDPYALAVKWGKKHLLRATQRRDLDAALERKRLFEKPLAAVISDEELKLYAGHTVPLPPNAKRHKVRRSISKRQRQYPGAPTVVSRIHRSVLTRKRERNKLNSSFSPSGSPPEFQKLNRNSWNVSW